MTGVDTEMSPKANTQTMSDNEDTTFFALWIHYIHSYKTAVILFAFEKFIT